ncbi:MAG: transporter ATP-binding protein [Haloplasmataceae bacterium]|nr:transporter ATP-binding protein [Haloplasmataceae bacterium]
MNIPLKKYFILFGKYLKPLKKQIVILFLLLALTVSVDLINPQILSRFIDMAKAGDKTKNLIITALIFIGAALIKQVIVVISTYVSQNVGWLATNGLREDLIKHCLHLDMSFHKSKKPGELIERLDGDVNALFNFFSKLFINLLNNVALLFGILILLFIEDWRIGVGLTIFAFIAMIVLWKVQESAVPKWIKEREQSANFFGFICEQITSTEDIKSSGAVSYVMYRFYQIMKSWFKAREKAFMMYGVMWSTTLLVFALGYAVAFSLSAYLYYEGIISIGTVFLIIYYTDLLQRPIEQIRSQLQDLQKAGASIVRVEELFAKKSLLIDGNELINTQGPLSIEMKNVNFRYEDGKLVLNNISLNLEKGKVLGLLGRTGSGKTTLGRLLVRMYDASEGSICLGDQSINDVSLSDLRNHIAYVTQDVQLFAATVRDNLTFFNPNINDEEILEAIEEMGLTKWFHTMPNGLDTLLNANGGGLSSGEAQLLSFIRVFLKNPQLVILDEASSRVDPITEKLIEVAINKLLINRTCIIIAHRLWTVGRADEILILDHGNILEQGKREVLANDSTTHFYHLLQTGMEEVLV